MSAETKAALDEAVRAHLADESPDSPLVMSYILTIAAIGGSDDKASYLYTHSAPPGSHILLGLAYKTVDAYSARR